MDETTLEQPMKTKRKRKGPMVDLGYLSDSGMLPRRALILYSYARKGVDTNKDLADELGASRALISHDLNWLRDEGYLHPQTPHQGPYTRPIKITAKGTRFLTKMLLR